ncbi:MAG: DUF2752 domain-containing protein [Clostridia bacterium]|nr:DUF2752 domain-containing protein [Clostridia bacterium]
MKIKEIKNKLIITFGLLSGVALLWCFDVPCPFVHFLNIECFGCGMTRAIVCALKGEFGAAFSHHAMFWSTPMLYVYFLFDGRVIGRKIADIIVLGAIAAGFVINWVMKLV